MQTYFGLVRKLSWGNNIWANTWQQQWDEVGGRMERIVAERNVLAKTFLETETAGRRLCWRSLEPEEVKEISRSQPGEGNGTPLQYSCLENPMDGGAWWAAVHGVAEGPTRLSDFTFTFHFPALEKEMATHSSVLAWRIPGTGEPGGLPSMGSHRVGHDWSDLAAAVSFRNGAGKTGHPQTKNN